MLVKLSIPHPLPTACDPNGLHRDNIVTPACRDVGEDGRRVTAQVWMSEVPVGEALFVRDPLLYQRVRALTRPGCFALTAGVGCVTGLSKQSRGKKAACRVTGHETPPPPKGAAALVEGIRRKQGRHFVQDLVSFPTIPTRHLTRVHLLAKVASFHSVVFPRGIAIEDAVGRGCWRGWSRRREHYRQVHGRKAAFSTTQMAGSAGSAGYGCLGWYEFP